LQHARKAGSAACRCLQGRRIEPLNIAVMSDPLLAAPAPQTQNVVRDGTG
jgi:hypothetical protein